MLAGEGERAFRLGVPASARERRAFPNRRRVPRVPRVLSFASPRVAHLHLCGTLHFHLHSNPPFRLGPRLGGASCAKTNRRDGAFLPASELSPLVDSDSKHTCRSGRRASRGGARRWWPRTARRSSGATTYHGVGFARALLDELGGGSSGNRSRSSPAPTTRRAAHARARSTTAVWFSIVFFDAVPGARRRASRSRTNARARARRASPVNMDSLALPSSRPSRRSPRSPRRPGVRAARETRGDRGDRVGVGGRFAVGHLVAGGVRVGVLVGASGRGAPSGAAEESRDGVRGVRGESLRFPRGCSAASAADRTTASISSDAASRRRRRRGRGRDRRGRGSVARAGRVHVRRGGGRGPWPIGEVGAGAEAPAGAEGARRWGNRDGHPRARGGRHGDGARAGGRSGRSWRGAGCRPTGEIILSCTAESWYSPPSSRARRRALADPMAPSGASRSPSAEGVDSGPRARSLPRVPVGRRVAMFPCWTTGGGAERSRAPGRG